MLIKPVISVFISLIILLLSSAPVSALTVVAKEEPPYIGNELPGQGLSMEIVQTALERAGYKTSFVFESWPRAYEGGLIGIYDVIGSIWKTDQREKDFVFSQPYLVHEIKFIKNKSSQELVFNNLDDLNGLIIGTLKGYAYNDEFLRSTKIMRMQQNHLLQNLLLLTQDKIDMTLGEVRKIRFELNKYMKGSIDKLQILPKPLISRGAHIAVSKSNPRHQEIIDRFNKALQDMKADGSYLRIIKKHDAE